MKEAVARANSNVALAKYWGKRIEALNLPYTGSISVTLAGLSSTARTSFHPRLQADRIFVNRAAADQTQSRRISAFIDIVRQVTDCSAKAEIEIESNFPIAAGLASSASTFAALALSTSRAAGLSLSDRDLSALARRGSGSAARSIHGGYVEWLAGESSDGQDSYAIQIASAAAWQIGIVVAITDEGQKRVGSREGMARAVKESPFFPTWLESHEADLDAIRDGIGNRDLRCVGLAAEHNCLKMHGVAMASIPPLLYWTPATVAVMQRVWRLRDEGIEAYFTIDAGPQVKVLCPFNQRDIVGDALGRVTGVLRTLLSEPGGGAELLEMS